MRVAAVESTTLATAGYDEASELLRKWSFVWEPPLHRASVPVPLRDECGLGKCPIYPRPLLWLRGPAATVKRDQHMRIRHGPTIEDVLTNVYDGGNSISAGSERCELTQFHFHRPSEEWIDGRAFDGASPRSYERLGQLAVVVIIIGMCAPNSAIQKIWAEVPEITDKVQHIRGVEISASEFLP